MAGGTRAAVLVERGSNPSEFNYARWRMREAGAAVIVVAPTRSHYELEDHSLGQADAGIADVVEDSFDLILIPGGLGPEKLRQDARVVEFVRSHQARGAVCAAICHGQQVFVSAGFMRGIRATAAWSMLDDLRMVGAVVTKGERAVRDGNIVTAMFPSDLPAFFRLVLAALERRTGFVLPASWGQRLQGQTWGIVVHDASDGAQVSYLRHRIKEEGGTALLLGLAAGSSVRFGSPAWEWSETGWSGGIDRALPDPGVVESWDSTAEANFQAIRADELDGLLLPGGLGTWMIREHGGLRWMIDQMHEAEKPIGAIGRGPKLLFHTQALAGRVITCAPEMRDDVIHATAPVGYIDQPAVRDGHVVTGRSSEDLPEFMRTLLAG